MTQIAEYYALSDILVCPSFIEVWGLVINEAMACGLPIICSDKVGAGYDLVKNDVNGYIYRAGDADELKNCLEGILDDESLRKRMGEKSLEIISKCRPEDYAEALLKAVNLVI